MSDFSKLKVKKNSKEYILNVCTQDTEQDITGTKNFTKLTVNSKNVVTSINGLPASEDGNVEITGGLELGDIGLAPLGIDETDNCRRYLNGQVILQSQFSKFTEKLKSAIELYPNLVTSEDNWQSVVNLSPLGQCGKFVIDDEAGTIRLPKVVNVMGALDLSTIGQTVDAGLPNITGNIYDMAHGLHVVGSADGVFERTGSPQVGNADGSGRCDNMSFDASRSSPIYGNSETVQQESIKYPYFIQVATSNNEDVQIDTQVRLNNPFSLFMTYWSPIELNNLSWLRSNKQWNNGAVYVSAYEFVLEKYNSGTEQTETIADVSVTYKLADNGMKIITDKSVYDALISASGSAFFFVLDTENTQFILPYTNGFAQFGNELGKFTEAGLPNITGSFTIARAGAHNGTGAITTASWDGYGEGSYKDSGSGSVTFDSSRSSSIYGNSDTVQPNSVTGYLYFYIGEVEQDANIIATSGLATDIANLKSRVTLEKTWTSGTSGYRVYSDGFCEQWGIISGKTSGNQVTFAIPYKDTNYSIACTQENADTNAESTADTIRGGSITTTGFIVDKFEAPTHNHWHTWGYIR